MKLRTVWALAILLPWTAIALTYAGCAVGAERHRTKIILTLKDRVVVRSYPRLNDYRCEPPLTTLVERAGAVWYVRCLKPYAWPR